jgi:hypothetical protein
VYKKLYKILLIKLLLISAVIALVLSGCSSNKAVTTGANQNVGYLSALGQSDLDTTLKASNGFQKVCENQNYIFEINPQTCEIAVTDKSANVTWYSNPTDRTNDTKAQADGIAMRNSQIILTYKDTSNTATTYYSSTDSVELSQYAFEPIGNGIKVTYDIGQKIKIYLAPPRITKTRFNSFLAKLDSVDKESLLLLYNMTSITDFDKGSQKINIADNPAYAYDSVYSIIGLFNSGAWGVERIPEYVLQESAALFKKAGYTYEDLKKDYAENGLALPENKLAVIRLSVEYKLLDDGFSATIPNNSISFDKSKYHLNQIELLPYFGAAGEDKTGYMFVPDGSGAIIDLNNQKTNYQPFSKNLYGNDVMIPLKVAPYSDGSQCYLPVFGLKQNDSAFIGIITAGDGFCNITADVSGRYNGYNHVNAQFITCPDMQNYNNIIGRLDLPSFQQNFVKSDLSVTYKFSYNDKADYTGMALSYRDYLVKNNLVKQNKISKMPLTINLIGATKFKNSILGFVFNDTKALTTYKQANEILNYFTDKGVGSLDLIYSGWSNNGIENSLANNAKLVGNLGNNKDFEALLKNSKAKGVNLYPDVNFPFVSKKSSFGFSERAYASRDITGQVGQKINYNPATLQGNINLPGDYAVKTSTFESLAKSFKKSSSRFDFDNLSLTNIGEYLYSDYQRNLLTDRTTSEVNTKKLLSTLNSYNLAISGGNAYTLPVASMLYGVPLESGKTYITDSDVPFYQIALSGVIPLSSIPINETSNLEYYTLKLIETGTAPTFSMMYDDNFALKSSDGNYYSLAFNAWKQTALDTYNKVNDALKDVYGKKIVSHKQTSLNVFETTYENNITIVVDYNTLKYYKR